MSTDNATPLMVSASTEVRRLRVRVVEGVDFGREVEASDEPIGIGTAKGNSLRLTDRMVSRYHVELGREGNRVRIVDHGSTNGTIVGSIVLRNTSAEITTPARIRVGETTLSVEDGELSLVPIGPESIQGMVGVTTEMRALFRTIDRVAPHDASVLVNGESGTGKELVARAIHDRSTRRGNPFVVMDCASIPPTMVASYLFGHERGAFTGAERQRIGAFERAHTGTLFLDEVGELTAEMQSALLGVLERGRFLRVGGTQEVEVDVRIVAATHRDLRAAVNDETFRLDLYYRLAIIRLQLPPLRQRVEDLPGLISHFLQEEGRSETVEQIFPPEAMTRLRRYAWPGNIRELRNVVLGTLALGTPQDPEPIATTAADPISGVLDLDFRVAKQQVVDEFERRYISRRLDAAKGNVKQAAADSGMDRSYLMELIKRHGLKE